jgi:Mg-chelatase subunit ChlD
MNAKLLAASLFALTAALVVLVPALGPAAPPVAAPAGQPVPPRLPALPTGQEARIDAVFVLDTTGSMGGLIQAAKDKIWAIASTLAAAEPAPRLRMGLVAYRDRGDDYVTRVVELSGDLDSVHAALSALEAQGGGDGPEDVNQALADALGRISWGQDPGTYRTLFLVGDAPPHTDYQGQTQYPELLAQARRLGIRVNAIQCGSLKETETEWQRIAQLGGGSFLRVDQDGGAVALASPFDERLARLSTRLDETRIYYGSPAERAAREASIAESKAAKAAAAPAALARRAGFVASPGGAASLLGKQELVEEVESGRVDLETLAAEGLPPPLAELDPESRRALVRHHAAERERVRGEIRDLSAQRAQWIEDQVKAKGGAKDSLDQKLFDTVRTQAAEAGLHYEGKAPTY